MDSGVLCFRISPLRFRKNIVRFNKEHIHLQKNLLRFRQKLMKFPRKINIYYVYHRVCNQIKKTVPLVEHGFQWESCYSIFSCMCMFCRSLFVLLYFFFCPLCCLFFFDLWIMITPLVSYCLLHGSTCFRSHVLCLGICFTSSVRQVNLLYGK